jgi:hypothetical protein
MIQIRRGEKENWIKVKEPLAAGQPGFDKKRHKIKIGNGKDTWDKLNYATGLFDYEILNKESTAKDRYKADNEDITVITYGTESPDEDTIGQIYLQYYDAEPEVDYLICSASDKLWYYQKWKSGIAKCWGSYIVTASIQNEFEGTSLYHENTDLKQINYPIEFIDVPSEVASIQSKGGIVWLANKGLNTETTTGLYSIISADKLTNAEYKINFEVSGRWR